jgi:hypothetical protein
MVKNDHPNAFFFRECQKGGSGFSGPVPFNSFDSGEWLARSGDEREPLHSLPLICCHRGIQRPGGRSENQLR